MRALALAGSLSACAAAVSAAQLVVGQVAPLSDPKATGNQLRIGLKVYFDAVNHAGGIHGATVMLVSKDRKSVRDKETKSDESVTKTRELIKESEPLVLAGILGTEPTEELVKSGLLKELDMALIGRTGATSLHEPVNPWVFHARASYRNETERIITQLATIGHRRIAVFHENSKFGKTGLAEVQDALKRKPEMQLVRSASYEPDTTDVADGVRSLAGADLQTVIVIANSSAAAEFYKTFRASGSKAQVVAISIVDASTVVKRLGKDAARGLVVTQVVPNPDNDTVPLIKELRANLKKYAPAGTEINQTIVEGYLTARVLVEAFRIAGPNPTRKKVRNALESIKNFDAGGVVIDFSPENHTGSRYVDLAILLQSGRLMR